MEMFHAIYFLIGVISFLISGKILNKIFVPASVDEYILVGFLVVMFGFGWPIALIVLCLYGIGKLFSFFS